MANLTFQDLQFHKTNSCIKVTFKKHFYFVLENKELNAIAPWNVLDDHTISFDCSQKKAEKQFHFLISKKIEQELFSNRGNKAYYVHQGPLIGAQRFGILESDTSVIEVRPMTTCNLNCNYCSIDEGIYCKQIDYYVDLDHLLHETKKLINLKHKPVTIRICSHGEPLLYPELEQLIAGLKKMSGVSYMTLGTNGTLLTKQKIKAFKKAGLDQIGLSLNAIDQEVAEKIAGCTYNIERMKNICRQIAKEMDLIIAPVYLPGINDDQIEKIISFAKELKARIGIQNFLPYKGGRNPVKGISMDAFYEQMHEWEKKSGIDLVKPDVGFPIEQNKCLSKSFKRSDKVVLKGCIGEYGVAKERLIKIGVHNKKKITIVRDKHNIYIGR